MRKKLTVGSLDSRAVGRHRTDFEEKEKTIYDEAERFLSDKEALEQHFENIDESSLSTEDKRKALEALKELAILRQKDFDEKISKERECIQQQQKQEIKDVSLGIEEITEEIDSMKHTKFEASSEDATTVIDTLEEKKSEFETEKEKYQEQLRRQMKQAENQARNMRNKKF